MPNPFTPKNRPAHPEEPAVVPSLVELDGLYKADLIELARGRGLDDTGTRADLIGRLAP
ncbi:MAG: SAP domain-containing protein [Pseudonocardia sp.]|nr:SAP domain-containing protein [Pseudonocardia sp.]